MTEVSLISEVLKQAPTVGVVVLVGWLGFKSYQGLVHKLLEIVTAVTAAMTANTAALAAVTAAAAANTVALTALREAIEQGIARAQERHVQLLAFIEAVPGKVSHEMANEAHARLVRERLERERPPA